MASLLNHLAIGSDKSASPLPRNWRTLRVRLHPQSGWPQEAPLKGAQG
jgi:hypothetical protein